MQLPSSWLLPLYSLSHFLSHIIKSRNLAMRLLKLQSSWHSTRACWLEFLLEQLQPLLSRLARDLRMQESLLRAREEACQAEGTVTEPQADEEVVQFTSVTQITGIAREEASAIKIQKAFRGYQARRALRAFRGLVRLKSLVQGSPAKRRTAHALRI